MYDYHLKFANEAEADSILYAEQTNEAEADSILYTGQADDPPTKVPKYALIDVIGVLYEHTGKTLNTEEGYIPETVAIDGWHVNVRCHEEVEEFAPYIVTPNTPNRAWA